jgi:long-chain acyl-CoA synthetase
MTHGNPYHRTKLRSVGLPIADTECRIVDPEDGARALSPGEVGEICLRGPQVAEGYLDDDDATRAAFQNGWLFTGDLGYVDEEGYLFIVDRKKEMVISSGYNVYPREVDEVLLMHPAVQEAATVGVPDAYRGEALKAYVAPKPGAQPSSEELRAHCRRHLAAYKVPEAFEVMATLPKNAMGKILKKELKLEKGSES